MAITKQQVFVASNFDEFRGIRTLISNKIDVSDFPIESINLDDNRADEAPPLQRSLSDVERSEVFLLLIGKEYGGKPNDHEKSYTHLEYEQAFNSESIVICCFVGAGCTADTPFVACSEETRALASEIMSKHTPSFYDTNEYSEDEIADLIFLRLMEKSLPILAGTFIPEYHAVDADFGQLDEELDTLMGLKTFEANFDIRSETTLDNLPHEELLKQRKYLEAREQVIEAMYALDLGEPSDAFTHLRRARELRPLDIHANYWLAKLSSVTGRLDLVSEAVVFASKAAKAAEDQGNVKIAVASNIIASRASAEVGNVKESLTFATKAKDLAPYRHIGHIEMAQRYFDCKEYDQAFDAAKMAFLCDPRSIFSLSSSVSMKDKPKEFRVLKRRLHAHIFKQVKEVLASEDDIRRTQWSAKAVEDRQGADAVNTLETSSLLQLLKVARKSGLYQRDSLKAQAACMSERLSSVDAIVKDTQADAVQAARSTASAKSSLQSEMEKLQADQGFFKNLVDKGAQGSSVFYLAIIFLGLAFGYIQKHGFSDVQSVIDELISTHRYWIALVSLLFAGSVLRVGLVGYARRALYQSAQRRLAELDHHVSKSQVSRYYHNEPELADTLDSLKRFCSRFQEQVDGFDSAVLKWAAFAPAKSMEGSTLGDVVRCTEDKIARIVNIKLDVNPLPLSLYPFSDRPLHRPGKFLAKRVSDHPVFYSRSGVFWEPTV